MTITVKGMRGSTCARRVFLTLEETGTPFNFELVHLFKGENKNPEYLKLQPFGRVPVLHDGDFHVFESRAISRYIANAYDKNHTLLPKDAKALAKVEQWISVEMCEYPADNLVGQLVFAPMRGAKPDEAQVAKDDAKLKSFLTVAEHHLGSHKFFAGDHFTLADIVYMPYTHLLLTIPAYKDLAVTYPNFGRWWSEVSSRPSWKKVNSESEF